MSDTSDNIRIYQTLSGAYLAMLTIWMALPPLNPAEENVIYIVLLLFGLILTGGSISFIVSSWKPVLMVVPALAFLFFGLIALEDDVLPIAGALIMIITIPLGHFLKPIGLKDFLERIGILKELWPWITLITLFAFSIITILPFMMSVEVNEVLVLRTALLLIFIVIITEGIWDKIVSIRNKMKDRLESKLRLFRNIGSIKHFMAVYHDRGSCLFYHPFTEERIQPDLISGFIAAITSVYGEIRGEGVRGTLEEIQYQGLRLNSYQSEYILGVLIMEEEITYTIRDGLQFFVEVFEHQYNEELDGWTGLVDGFDPEWVVSTLNTSFSYIWHLPQRLGATGNVNRTDTKILDYINGVRDERNEFYLKDLLTPLAEKLGKTEAEVLDRLLHLQDKDIIIPIGVHTILQRQGMGLLNDVGELPLIDTEEESEIEESKSEIVEESEELTEGSQADSLIDDIESLLDEMRKEKKEK